MAAEKSAVLIIKQKTGFISFHLEQDPRAAFLPWSRATAPRFTPPQNGTYPRSHLEGASQLLVDHLRFVVDEFDGGSDPGVFPLAVLLPPGDHDHAEQNPADTEAQVPGQVHGVQHEHGSTEVHEQFHQ